MQDETLRYEAISRVENGEDKKTVADDLGVSHASVMRWHREYRTAKDNGTLSELLDIDKLILATAGKLLESGAMTDEIKSGVASFKGRLSKLEVLQEDMVLTATAINTQIKSRIMSIEHTSELLELTECLCTLQNAFFNKNMTQVNVQNNYDSVGSAKYGEFLNDKPTHN